MKTLVKHIPLLILFSLLSFWSTAQPRIGINLEEKLQTKEDSGFIPLVITLQNQYSNERLLQKATRATHPQARRDLVVKELKSFSQEEQQELIIFLQHKEKEGLAKNIRGFWIGNFVHAHVTREVIDELSARKDISLLDYDKEFKVLDLESPMGKESMTLEKDAIRNKNMAWSISHIQADAVWEMGYTGEEIVVAVLDTGVNYEHNDLQGNMWEHPDFPMHGFNFVENNLNPMDVQGHGTHCAGTVAGNGASGTQTGIAPAAKIMALKVLSDEGSGSQVSVWDAAQFAVENGAHILSLSLGFKIVGNPDRSMMRTVMNNVRNAGLVAFVAAGNEGESGSDQVPYQVRTPGDVPPPWLHPDQTLTGGTSGVISIGSTDNNDNVAASSSRGPVEWETVNPYNDYPFNPGMGLIRPDVVAPGVNITSLNNNDISGYKTLSGTSMATPAVAGVAALMLSRNPFLLPEDISQILEETADALSFIKSNTSGSGVVNALEAIEQTPLELRYAVHHVNDEQGNNDGNINPSEVISLDLSIENPTENSFSNVEATLQTTSPYVSLSDSTALFGDFTAGETRPVENAFSFQVADNIPGDHVIDFTLVVSEQQSEETMVSRFSESVIAPALSVGRIIIDDSEQGNNNGILEAGETASLNFNISNTGQMANDEGIVELSSLLPYVQTEDDPVVLPSIQPGDSLTVSFNAETHPSVPAAAPVSFMLLAQSGAYTFEKEFSTRLGLIMEDWESGDFDQFDWQFTTNEEPWTIVSEETYQGDYAVKSGDISSGQSSSFSITLDVQSSDSISFYRKVSSSPLDYLRFFIDGVMLGQWSGEQDWLHVSFPVEPGTRTFTWSYQRGILPAQNEDCAWIDNILLPVSPPYIAFAGFDNQICGEEDFETKGYASGHESLLWSSTGDGTFDEAESLQAIYSPGEEDMNNGTTELSLAIFNSDEEMVSSHTMTLSVFPASAEIDLGEDVELCEGESLLLDAGEGFESYLWSDGSQEQTLMVTATQPDTDTTYWVRATDLNGCESYDSINIYFDECLNVPSHTTEQPEIVIYPNPAKSYLNISSEQPIKRAALTDLSGRILLVKKGDGKNLTMETSELNAGIYFVQVYTAEGEQTLKVVIQE